MDLPGWKSCQDSPRGFTGSWFANTRARGKRKTSTGCACVIQQEEKPAPCEQVACDGYHPLGGVEGVVVHHDRQLAVVQSNPTRAGGRAGERENGGRGEGGGQGNLNTRHPTKILQDRTRHPTPTLARTIPGPQPEPPATKNAGAARLEAARG